jgi:xylan 1,4-beta-xylosidase
MIQFSFMPSALASDPGHTIYASPFVISPPKDMHLWCQLVEEFLTHVVHRYGIQEVRSWLFSVWNEPDTSHNMFGFDSEQLYYDLYLNTYQTVKAFDSELCFGSPSLFPVCSASYDWMHRYLNFTKENFCVPEFIDIHFYSDDFASVEHASADFSWTLSVSEDPDYFSKFLNKIHNFLKQQNLSSLPLYITEWNFTVSHRNLLNDTCFTSCYLVKNFLENYDRASSFGYWSLTDFIEENQPASSLFHGGMGLFTSNSIPKPTYHAMCMLRHLGDCLLASGEGYFITRRGQDIVILLYNYEHCNPLFTSEGFGLTESNRYGVFPLNNVLDISVTLTELPCSAYRVTETILNRTHGSAFDQWVRAGATDLNPQEMDWLRNCSLPDLQISRFSVLNGEFLFSASLDPLEVRLVELIPENHGFIS